MVKKSIKPANPVPLYPGKLLFDFPLKSKYIFLALLGFVFYANSLLNKYAFDDGIVIVENTYVQMGIRGIPQILTHDSYSNVADLTGQSIIKLTGGRFRPLSEIIFAIEQQLFGSTALSLFFLHLINVVVYMSCIIVVFYFLENFLFKKTPRGSDMAFLAAVLFTIHPLHTEVVANIKSLDEILSLAFIMLTFIYSLKYLSIKGTAKDPQRIKYLAVSVVAYLFALLSKEYAVTLIFFIPFMFYLLGGKNPIQAILASFPYYIVFAVYLLLRYNAVGFNYNSLQNTNLASNPYLYATHFQKIATEWFVLGKYVGLLFFPYPLSCDYSYNQIPYHSFLDIKVILSILIYVGILVWGIILMLKKNILSFAAFFFLFNIIMISNFFLDIGATMGERLAFHASIGFIVILSWCIIELVYSKVPGEMFKNKKGVVLAPLLVIGVFCLGETVARNAEWKNDTTLFIHDVEVVPNSFLVNSNAGLGFVKLSQVKENTNSEVNAYLDSARKYLSRSLQYNENYEKTYIDLAGVYLHLGILDSAKYCWDMVLKFNPNDTSIRHNLKLLSQLYFANGFALGQKGNLAESLIYLKKAFLLDSNNLTVWCDIGAAYFYNRQYDSATYWYEKTLQYEPGNIGAKKGLNALSQLKHQGPE